VSAAHSKLGASSMYRWSACPASVRFTKDMPNTSSVYAQEGTATHAVASDLLEGKGTDCIDFEMIEAVQVYVEAIRELVTPGATLLVEHKFDLSCVYPGCFGTADAVIYQPDTKTLYVMDYKHGAGMSVEAEGNPQLKYYALGALMTTNFKPVRVVMGIVQPRCFHPAGPVRTTEMDALDLLDFRADLIAFAKETENENAVFADGAHCHFCPGAGVCPHLQSKALAAATLEFSPAVAYDPDRLKLALDSREAVKAWLKAVDEFAYHEAEAGRCPTGYKLVAKRPTRKWKAEGDTAEYLQDAGFTASQIYDRKLKSPAQVEALYPKKKDVPEALAALIESVSSRHTLVPDSDKRAPAKPNAADEFSPVALSTN